MIDEKLLKNEERAMLSLRSLYQQYGYMPFKMSKFEEYDLYVRNKEFLVSDSVITFNDTDGRLLALKPDVTLSIIKNGVDEPGAKQKLYYNENVYRVSGSTHLFKEIMQSGAECIGDIDFLDLYELVYLAAKSLSMISENFILDISHMGVLSAVLENASSDEAFKKEALRLIADKNRHDTYKLCEEYGVSAEAAEMLILLIDSCGRPVEVLPKLSCIKALDNAFASYCELESICALLSKTEFSNKINLDFSVVNNMNYYNGIVFKGFLNGICEGVLSGGEYDVLMRRMGRKSKAVGFAIYLDLLEGLENATNDADVDVLLIYGEKNTAESVIEAKQNLVIKGKSVMTAKNVPSGLRYKELFDMRKGGSK